MSFRLCLLRPRCKAGALHTDAGHLFPHEVYALAVATSTGFSYVCYPVTNSPHEKSPPPSNFCWQWGITCGITLVMKAVETTETDVHC